MAIDKLNPKLIETIGASDGDALVYVSANGQLEFGSVAVDTSSLSASIDTVQDNVATNASSITALNAEVDQLGSYANSTFATDTNLNTVQDNVATNASSITANKSISDTFGTYANSTFASGNVNAVQSNVTAVGNELGAFGTYANANFLTTAAANVASDNYAIDASTNTFTLAQSVSNVNNIFVILDGLIQSPDTYTVSDTTLTISNVAPLPLGINVDVRYLQFVFPGTIDGGGV
jgi:prophage DNA circulation protein